MTTSLYWYDYETFGIDAHRDRPVQFAGVRTDLELNVIGEPLVQYCKPANDFLPHPEACLVTGITPQLALKKGVIEAEFIKNIHREFMKPQTCVVGYNNIQFDDEVTRFTLYRNFYDAYAREWQNGNSRWDLINVVRLAYALRPEGIEWCVDETGKPSFKLEGLTKANHIKHEGAHDALSDVYATIALAKLIRDKQPKLFDYVFTHRDKRSISELLNVHTKAPVLHVSSRFAPEKGCLAFVMPLAMHPTNKNGVIVYDLSVDPSVLLKLSVEQIKERVFTRREELAEKDLERIPLKTIHINKSPIVLPRNVMREEDAKRLNLDVSACERHAKILQQQYAMITKKVAAIFAQDRAHDEVDPDVALYYGGFFNEDDKRLMTQLREMSPEALATTTLPFRDERLPEMVFRYRARNYPHTLSEDELLRWNEFRKNRFTVKDSATTLLKDEFFAQINALNNSDITDEKRKLLHALETYAHTVTEGL